MRHPARFEPAAQWSSRCLGLLALLCAATAGPSACNQERVAPSGGEALFRQSPYAPALGVPAEMLAPEFWVRRVHAPDARLMTPEGVAAYDAKLRDASEGSLVDLARFPLSLTRDELMQRAGSWAPGEGPHFREGRPLSQQDIEALAENRNLDGIRDSNPVSPGVVLEPAQLRMWPTHLGVYEADWDREFDMLQATSVAPSEPLVVLHESRDHAWWLVRTRLCDGWLPKKDVGLLSSREEWLGLVAPQSFLVVTGPRLVLEERCGAPGAAGLRFPMGSVLPLAPDQSPRLVDGRSSAAAYIVMVAVAAGRAAAPEASSSGRDFAADTGAASDSGGFAADPDAAAGTAGPDPDTVSAAARLVEALVPLGSDVSAGFLPYTRGNVLRQAFKMLGESYGWGGLGSGVDCSSFVGGVLATMGVVVPRNTAFQVRAPAADFPLADLDPAQRLSALAGLPPGTFLYLKGHVMLLLGVVDGRPLVLHALAAHADVPEQTSATDTPAPRIRVPVMAVVVTGLDLLRMNGQTLLESLTLAKQFVDDNNQANREE
jgi:cell wall-associated NlpC family hydrolase